MICARVRRLVLALSLAAAPALASTFSIEDLVRHETLGPVAVDPKERWAVVQSTRPWNEAPGFDLADQSYQALSRLTLFDLTKPGAGRPLLDIPGQGFVAGAPSPDGERLIVHRVAGRNRELGVLQLADRSVRWSGLTTEPSAFGRTAAWIDNESVLVIATEPDAPRRRFGRIWQTPAAMTAAWAAAARGEISVTQTGAGRLAERRPPWPPVRLVRFNALSGEAKTLLEREVVDFELSPDRTKAAAVVEAGVAPARPEPVVSNIALRRRRLLIIDLTAGDSLQPAPKLDISAELLSWSPGGGALLVVGRRDDEAWSAAKVWRVGADGQPPTAVGEHPVAGDIRRRFAAGAAAWLGDEPVLAEGEVWRTGADAAISDGRLLALDHEAMFLQRRDGTWRVGRDGLQTRVQIRPGAMRADPEASGRVISHPFLLTASDWAPAASPIKDGWRFEATTEPTGVVRLHGRLGGRDWLLARANAGWADIALAVAKPVRHPDASGAPLTSWLYLPPDRSAGQIRGLIVVPYPGDGPEQSLRKHARRGGYGATDVHVLTGRGFAVLVPSTPFEDPSEPAKGFAAGLLRAVDAAGAQYGVPTDRLAVWGHSYGGWAALTAGVQTDRFDALVASAPVANLAGFYGSQGLIEATFPQYGYTSGISWFETGRGGMGAPPWADPARYIRNSPAMFADRLKTPTLIAVGDLDFTTAESRQMFGLLERAGGDVVLRTYHGSDHGYISPAQLRDFYDAGVAFIEAAFAQESSPSPAPTPRRPEAEAPLP